MKIQSNLLRLVAGTLLLTFSLFAQAAGLLSPSNSQLLPLEIKQHHVDVTVEDGYAITSVTQTFSNSNDTTLEAIYSFPVPEKAAVGEFTYWIDGKPVTGEVLKKKEARNIYEQEKSQGRETALTEKDEYKIKGSEPFNSTIQKIMRINTRCVP